MRTLLLMVLGAGCGPVKIGVEDTVAETGVTREEDQDRDGSPAEEDCDDADASVHPGAEETCDGLDNDCDGLIDDADPDLSGGTWYTDGDDDGYGDDASATLSCTQPAGTIATGGDCDDADPNYHPGADEGDCADPNDYNCDGSTGMDDGDGDGSPACQDCDDADASISGESSWYTDGDGDGYGDDATATLACFGDEGQVATGGDCDDADTSYHPGADEGDCTDPDDYNCDGSVAYADADGDGFAACEDCDDGDSAVYPDATEVCDGVDDDCDGLVDDDDDGVTDQTSWYADGDSDHYGSGTAVVACDAPRGYVGTPGDCDDASSSVNPGALETCDGVDDDCDGLVDDDDSSLGGGTLYYPDADSDGYGASSGSTRKCSAPAGYATSAGDCDDADADINPGQSETCDALDNDCSGDIDDGGVCPCTVDWYDDEAYMFCTDRTDWSAAQTSCETYGYQLTSINDGDEHAWLDDTAYSVRSSRVWWTGYTDSTSEGTWVWEDGSGSTYDGWADGEPGGGRSQNCALMWPRYGGYWYDYYCSYDTLYYGDDYGIGYICESG